MASTASNLSARSSTSRMFALGMAAGVAALAVPFWREVEGVHSNLGSGLATCRRFMNNAGAARGFNGAAIISSLNGVVRLQPACRDNPTHRQQGIFHGRLSWLWL